jgi:hypothetical protein
LTKVQKKKNETDSAIVPTKMWLSFQWVSTYFDKLHVS